MKSKVLDKFLRLRGLTGGGGTEPTPIEPNFCKITVTNTRSGTGNAVTIIGLQYDAETNYITDKIYSITSSKSGEVFVDRVGNNSHHIVILTPKAGPPPTITSDYVTLIGHLAEYSGSSRCSVAKIEKNAPNYFDMTVGSET